MSSTQPSSSASTVDPTWIHPVPPRHDEDDALTLIALSLGFVVLFMFRFDGPGGNDDDNGGDSSPRSGGLAPVSPPPLPRPPTTQSRTSSRGLYTCRARPPSPLTGISLFRAPRVRRPAYPISNTTTTGSIAIAAIARG